MPRLLVALLVALLLSAGTARAQYQPVVLMCGQPAAPCSATNPVPVTPGTGSLYDVNITQVASAAVKTGSGTASGSMRVELPTNGTGVVGLNAGANTIGAVTQASGPWTSNITQFGSSAVVTGTGTGGAGIPRVTISNDSTLAANQSVNLAQVAGVATATGSGTATGALRVELPTNGTGVVGLNAGAANIGNVGGKTVSVCVTPTITAANNYGANYVVGGLLTFANAWTATGSGILQGVVVTIKKVETNGFTFIPFNSNPSNTTWTDAAVAAINTADIPATREAIPLAAYSGLGTMTVAYATGLGQAMAPASTTQYGVLLANAALTNQFAAGDVQVCIKTLQDL